MNNCIKILLTVLTICNCYSMENNSIEENNNKQAYTYCGMTTEEINTKLVRKFGRDVHFWVEKILKQIIEKIDQNTEANDKDKIFQRNLKYKLNKVTEISKQIKERYKETLNTKNKILDITDLLKEDRKEVYNIEELFKGYIRGQNSNAFYNKLTSYFKNNGENELLLFVQDRISTSMLSKSLDAFCRDYIRYYPALFNFIKDDGSDSDVAGDWEIIM